jgi:hypothetical protein
MDIHKAFSNVFQAFMALPNAEQHLNTGKPIPPELLLNIPPVAKEVFNLEPGCVVHYSAIKEKLQLLGPHIQKSPRGPELMNYFAELRKTRNRWAVAFANYQAQMMTKVHLERSLYGRVLTASERNEMPGPAWKVSSESLAIATQQLLAVKTSREFVEKVRILEECTKKYTEHSRLKAMADRAAIALAQQKIAEAEQVRLALAKQKQEEKRKKQAEARKAKKAAAQAATKATQKNSRIQSVFNPDMPDFAQFVNNFATVTTPPATNPASIVASIMGASVAATGSPKQAAKRGSNKTSPPAKLTDAGVKKQRYTRKVGNSPGSRAAASPSTTQLSVSPAASQSSANSYAAQGPCNPHAAQVSDNSSVAPGPVNAGVAPASVDNANPPDFGHIAKVFLSPTDEPYIMVQEDFGGFVKSRGYPLPNCFVGPLHHLADGRVVYMEHQPRYTPDELQMYNQPGLYPPPTRYISFHPTEEASQGQNEITPASAIGSPSAPEIQSPPAPAMASTPTPEMQSTPAPQLMSAADMELEQAILTELGFNAPDVPDFNTNWSAALPDATQPANWTAEPTINNAQLANEVPNAEAQAPASAPTSTSAWPPLKAFLNFDPVDTEQQQQQQPCTNAIAGIAADTAVTTGTTTNMDTVTNSGIALSDISPQQISNMPQPDLPMAVAEPAPSSTEPVTSSSEPAPSSNDAALVPDEPAPMSDEMIEPQFNMPADPSPSPFATEEERLEFEELFGGWY